MDKIVDRTSNQGNNLIAIDGRNELTNHRALK